MAKPWSPAFEPTSRPNKPGWFSTHEKLSRKAFNTKCETVLIGDSIIRGLTRYENVWNRYLTNVVNLGIGGDMTQHVLWRIRNTRLSSTIKHIVVHCGTNNIDHHQPGDIVKGLIKIGEEVHRYKPNIKIIVSSILPRVATPVQKRKINEINESLKIIIPTLNRFYFIHHSYENWTQSDGTPNPNLYFKDMLHLIEPGNVQLAKVITSTISKIKNSKHTSSPSHLPTTHLLPARIAKVAATPKWGVCEYVHFPPPLNPPSLTFQPSQPKQSHSQKRPSSSHSFTSYSSQTSSSTPSTSPTPKSSSHAEIHRPTFISFLKILFLFKILWSTSLNLVYILTNPFLTFFLHVFIVYERLKFFL